MTQMCILFFLQNTLIFFFLITFTVAYLHNLHNYELKVYFKNTYTNSRSYNNNIETIHTDYQNNILYITKIYICNIIMNLEK